MSKNKFGKFVALATISGVIAAGISYFVKYKSFNSELDEDFHDFEGKDPEFDGQLPHACEALNRTYVSLSEKGAEAADTAKNAAQTVACQTQDMADALEDHVSKAAQDTADTIKDAAGTAAKAAEQAKDCISASIEEDLQ